MKTGRLSEGRKLHFLQGSNDVDALHILAKLPETSKEYLPHASFPAAVVRDVLTSDAREHTLA